ncbi:MAG: fasciclin domain-containing protein [Marinifilaceae bacterium]
MIKNKITIWLLLMVSMACSTQWDDHYGNGQAVVTNKSVLDYINSNPDYSKFAALLNEINASELFNKGVQLTVWVPKNEDIPELKEMTDSVKELTIKNHISILPYITVDMRDLTKVTSFSGKKLGLYSEDGVAFRVNNCRLAKTDMVCTDGVVHEISGFLNLQNNVKDYITTAPEYTMLQELINSTIDTVFDKNNSTLTGEVDALGRPIYDSVFIYPVRFYNRTKLHSEDTVFTLLLTPDWVLQEELSDYYKALRDYRGENAEQSDSLQVNNWLRNTVVYHGLHKNLELKDKINSFFGTPWFPKYNRVGNLQEFSNGLVWQVTDLYIPRSIIFPTDGSGVSYIMNDIYTKNKESIVVRPVDCNTDDEIVSDAVETSDRTAGYTVTISPVDASANVPYNIELSWTLGKTTTSGKFRQITQIPGEYSMELVFKKVDEMKNNFDVFINDNFITHVNMNDYRNEAVGKEIKITKRVEIAKKYAQTATQIKLRTTGGTGEAQTLSVYSIFFKPTNNNH